MYIRKKEVKGGTYYQAVEGYRDAAGRVRHRTIISLGQCATIDEAIAETKRQERRIRRRLGVRIGEPVDTTKSYMSATRKKYVERQLARLTQQEERRDALRKVAATFSVDTTG